MNSEEYCFEFLIYQDEGVWCIQCLEHNFISTGKSSADAVERLKENIICQIELSRKHNKNFTEDVGSTSKEVTKIIANIEGVSLHELKLIRTDEGGYVRAGWSTNHSIKYLKLSESQILGICGEL